MFLSSIEGRKDAWTEEKTIYKVAIYIRLSKEDVDRGYDESESIKNQRTLLTEYVQKLGWKYQLIDTL